VNQFIWKLSDVRSSLSSKMYILSTRFTEIFRNAFNCFYVYYIYYIVMQAYGCWLSFFYCSSVYNPLGSIYPIYSTIRFILRNCISSFSCTTEWQVSTQQWRVHRWMNGWWPTVRRRGQSNDLSTLPITFDPWPYVRRVHDVSASEKSSKLDHPRVYYDADIRHLKFPCNCRWNSFKFFKTKFFKTLQFTKLHTPEFIIIITIMIIYILLFHVIRS